MVCRTAGSIVYSPFNRRRALVNFRRETPNPFVCTNTDVFRRDLRYAQDQLFFGPGLKGAIDAPSRIISAASSVNDGVISELTQKTTWNWPKLSCPLASVTARQMRCERRKSSPSKIATWVNGNCNHLTAFRTPRCYRSACPLDPHLFQRWSSFFHYSRRSL
jgi:hypothetical protein